MATEEQPSKTKASNALTLQDIPQEVLLKVLTFLDVEDIISFSSLNRHFRDVYQNATLIVYRAALLEAGMIDISDSSTSPTFTIPEKLALLKQRRESWRTLQMLFQYSEKVAQNVAPSLRVQLNFRSSSIYDFSCGVYVLGQERTSHRDTQFIRYLDLTTARAEGGEINTGRVQLLRMWPSVQVSKEERIVDFGLALREHDLIALITEAPSSDDPNSIRVDMHLRQLSTGKPHPLARIPTIFLQNRVRGGSLAIMLEVSGPNLVLLLTMQSFNSRTRDWLAVYNWYTGEQITSTTSRHNTWHGFVFLTNQIILLPNARASTLDIIKLPELPSADKIAVPTGNVPHTDMFTRLLRLRLPPLLPDVDILSVLCRSEPNPFGTPHPDVRNARLDLRRGGEAHIETTSGERRNYIKGTPLVSDPDTSIILMRLYLADQLTLTHHNPTFFIHRSSIIKILEERKDAYRDAIPGPIGEEEPSGDGQPSGFPGFQFVVAGGNGALVEDLEIGVLPEEDPADVFEVQMGVEAEAEGTAGIGEQPTTEADTDEDAMDTDTENDPTDEQIEMDEVDTGFELEHESDEDEEGADAEIVAVEENDADANADEEGGDFDQDGFQIFMHQMRDLRRRQIDAYRSAADEASREQDSQVVAWRVWGPENTRWVPMELPTSNWVTTTCGQRAVLEDAERLIVWDFNPYSVKRERHRQWEQDKAKGQAEERNTADEIAPRVVENRMPGDFNADNGPATPVPPPDVKVNIHLVDELSAIRSRSSPLLFREDVVSSLPYVEASTPRSREFVFSGGTMLDEDHVVGLQRGGIETVDVFSV